MCAAIRPCDPTERASQLYTCPTNGVPSTSITYKQSPPIPASQHPPTLVPDDVSHNIVATLTMQGIMIRDFAYENTLPPVTTVPRFSVQVQPRPRMLKRTRDMLDGHDHDEESDEEDPNVSRTFYIDSNGTGVSHGYRYRKKTSTLERTLTEPAEEVSPSQAFNTRAQVFTQPCYRPSVSPQPRHINALTPTTPQRPMGKSSMHSLSAIDTDTIPQSQPSVQGESQETESWIDTPLVTPNGSLQWPVQDTSALPASPLESILPQLPAADSQNVTLSLLGFSPERSQQTASSPAGTPSRARHPHLPPPAEFRTSAPSPAPTKPRPSASSPARRTTRSTASPTLLQEAPAPRYDLRQRPQATNTKPPTARASSHASEKPRPKPKSVPAAKKRKITPPPPPLPSGRGQRRKNGNIKENS